MEIDWNHFILLERVQSPMKDIELRHHVRWMEVSRNRNLISFPVYYPRDLYFIYSIDASEFITNAYNLFILLDKVVEEVREENVV